MGKRNYYYVDVRFLDDHVESFQLPNDLLDGVRQYRYENPNTWESLLTGALINVPSEPYTKANNHQPMIRLGYIERFYAQNHQQKKRSRGQFLIKENWQTSLFDNFINGSRFIRHDYPKKNKVILFFDYCRWKRRFHFKKLTNSKSLGQ